MPKKYTKRMKQVNNLNPRLPFGHPGEMPKREIKKREKNRNYGNVYVEEEMNLKMSVMT